LKIEEIETPSPKPGEVLVRVRAAGICGSDLHGYRGHWERGSGARQPHQSGHELAGEVAALGPGVSGLRAGQRVGIEPEHLVGCHTCRYCTRGDYHLCPNRGMRHGEQHSSHGFSAYDVCLARNCYPLPDHVSTDAAAILDCYACGVHAVNRTPPRPHHTVVVIGTGAIGMTLGQVARAAGAGRVLMVGTRDEPLAIARAAGAADDTIAQSREDAVQAVLGRTHGEGADLVFETVGGNAPTLSQAVAMARPGGTVSILGIFTQPQEVAVQSGYRKELVLTWSNSYATWQGVREYQIALDLLAAGRCRAEPLITHRFPLERIADGFAAAADKRASGALKVLIHP
jgi:threonine dehydrogenase-like Zn-dependent dehydrogenase